MFRIKSLTMYNNDQEYTYNFSNGINYIQGKNDTGKTVFYKFLDFMFGSQGALSNEPWFKDTLSKASIIFEFNNIEYEISRSLDGKLNYFRYCDEKVSDTNEDPIDIEEYKLRIQSVFSSDIDYDSLLFRVTGEHLTYRTFTLFSFLDEINQGKLNDFHTKCSEIQYALKINAILNYLFNNNLSKIVEETERLEELKKKRTELLTQNNSSQYLRSRINSNLRILNISEEFTGSNIEKIKETLNQIKAFEESKRKEKKPETLSELYSVLVSIDEQIKVWENSTKDAESLKSEAERRKKLLGNLHSIIQNKESYSYLVEPIIGLIEQLDKSISFQRIIIEDKTITALRKKREVVKKMIADNKPRFTPYSLSEKETAMALINYDLQNYMSVDEEELKRVEEKIKQCKKNIKDYQSRDDKDKIETLSEYITKLYSDGTEVSTFIRNDFEENGFRIQYIKKGHELSPTKLDRINDEEKRVTYSTGSLARQTLIQLCGYLGFLKQILSDKSLPIIPMLVVDHISKPFDADNQKAIGSVLNSFMNDMEDGTIQIFLLEDKCASSLGINANTTIQLVDEEKTGFNPFYFSQNT